MPRFAGILTIVTRTFTFVRKFYERCTRSRTEWQHIIFLVVHPKVNCLFSEWRIQLHIYVYEKWKNISVCGKHNSPYSLWVACLSCAMEMYKTYTSIHIWSEYSLWTLGVRFYFVKKYAMTVARHLEKYFLLTYKLERMFATWTGGVLFAKAFAAWASLHWCAVCNFVNKLNLLFMLWIVWAGQDVCRRFCSLNFSYYYYLYLIPFHSLDPGNNTFSLKVLLLEHLGLCTCKRLE